jgi:hypothetical protein
MGLVELGARRNTLALKLRLPCELALLIGESTARCCLIRQALAIHRPQSRHLNVGTGQLGLRVGDRDKETRLIKFEQHFTSMDELIVMYIDLGDTPCHIGADIHPGCLNVGVVGGFIAATDQIKEQYPRRQ